MRRAAQPPPAIWAEIGAHRYPLHLGAGLIDRLGSFWAERAAGAGVLLVSDGGVQPLADRARESLSAAGFRVAPVAVAPGEHSKSLGELERLSRVAAASELRRADAVVAIGGGVVGDLGGFLAATYQRGIRLVHVPTTLLAMVDSAVGGKTGVDLPEGKNYVGAIWQPELVVMDLDALLTLPAAELASGFAEVIKYGLLEGEELFGLVEGWGSLPGPEGPLTALIRRCVEYKLRVVAADERETGLRAVLNLGHTVGHGIEAAGGYVRHRHGEAISLGLLTALRLSVALEGLPEGWRERTAAVLERHGLPTVLDEGTATDAILAALGRDKKSDGASLNMVLLPEPGEPRLGCDPPRELLLAAIEELRG
jgi:3-dehydroquinate synthase